MAEYAKPGAAVGTLPAAPSVMVDPVWLGRLQAERDALAARVVGLTAVLASFEWLPDGHGFRWCPVCRFNPAGHAPDCRLAAALAPSPPPPDWTATPPTGPGWYWGVNPPWTNEPKLVRLWWSQAGWRATWEGDTGSFPASELPLWWPVPLAPPPSPGRAGEGGEG